MVTQSQRSHLRFATFGVVTVLICHTAAGQQAPPVHWTSEQDHQNMMDQLGIKALRPGPSGNEKAPNHANLERLTADIPHPRRAIAALLHAIAWDAGAPKPEGCDGSAWHYISYSD